MKKYKTKLQKIIIYISAFVLILTCFYFISLNNYLLFHSIAEIFSVVVACGIFMFLWNSRSFLEDNSIIFLGIAYLFIGGLDFIHTLAYSGMGVFPKNDANLPTQIWIVSRYVESITLLCFSLFRMKNIKSLPIISIYFVSIFLLLLSIFYLKIFPLCYVEGAGLTPFKKISEYTISLILCGAVCGLLLHKKRLNKNVFNLLLMSIILTIGSEISLTFYVSTHGIFNLTGHLLKLISFYMIYKALIETGLRKPYGLLYREMKQMNIMLQKTLDEVKTLRGLIPICANCKKIRNDRGYWDEVEVYVSNHSEAEFSHAICPDCAKKLYPEYFFDNEKAS
jgi:hypothetical protein